jgi:branched-chain amino acid transport system ATP-binding protein
MLELRGVDGYYGRIPAVRDVTLTIGDRESLALLGRTGAGKSTLLKLIAGVMRPAAGEVRWEGEVVNHLTPDQRLRRGIVLVPEGRQVFPDLTVDENIRIGAYWRRPAKKEVERLLAETYELLPRLAARRHHRGGSLSGGEQQMLALGRGLMGAPKLLLLDEPSLGLAPLVVQALYDLLGKLAQTGVGIVLVEQYVSVATQVCSVVAGVRKGRLVFHGAASRLATDPRLLDIYMGMDGRTRGDTHKGER